MHEGSADTERMDVQESDVHEELGGWTEVELNAPKEFHPKVCTYTYYTVCTYVYTYKRQAVDIYLCTIIHTSWCTVADSVWNEL